ncbi:hypothetical protein [Nesterenkonia natronophila]|uniref:DUF2267 domain-containing protein n=1 Tax=Nesterenkonia natronophila TaxID=2174932 RepID=A0A3A4F3U2_9MICC|nr:hypothetical protein [Nesterenkonia natronophila]RJN32496.1 hypothetical protein D3250_01205 [Nesterenkonia natronophila]
MPETNTMREPASRQREEPQNESPSGPAIAIYSDRGRTSMWVSRMLTELEDPDGSEGDWASDLSIVHKRAVIPLRQDATLDLDEVKKWAQEDEADLTVVVTEIPRMAGRRPKRSELHFADSLGVISLPALGPFRLRKCLRRELRICFDALRNGSTEDVQRHTGLTARVENQKGGDTVFTTAPRFVPARTWTTLGMVANNEPLWSLPKLSAVFSAAAATGAFGVFFSTIWEMATFLPEWRLAAVSAIAVVVMVSWLILANRLWDRPGPGGKREAFMYNASTVISLLVSVGILYLMLFVAILLVGLLLIDPEFLGDTIGEEAALGSYVDIAWLSASMGTVAGAIGSNFDDDADLRNLTQGSREMQRYPRDAEQR